MRRMRRPCPMSSRRAGNRTGGPGIGPVVRESDRWFGTVHCYVTCVLGQAGLNAAGA
jgi:hypothetical protein